MNINPSSNIRTVLYLVTVFINAVVGVVTTSGVVVPIAVLAIVAGFNAVVALMAGANVAPDK